MGPSPSLSYLRPEWKDLSLEKRAGFLARQGHSFVNADSARVVEQGDGDELRDVPKNGKTVGEIVVRGNIVMKGYYRDEEASRKAFLGGHFHSGDLAVWYPERSVSIQDRSKDLIISGGENASSLVIEQVLSEFPAVMEVSCVARSHPKWGERAMAFVILHPHAEQKWKGRDAEFEAALKKFARGKLPGFTIPEWAVIVKELPKTSTGKIQKVILRQRVAKS